MSVRQRLGGASTLPDATRGRYAPRDLNSFPLPAGSILERSEITQAAIDSLFVIFGAIFVSTAAIGLAAVVYILLFVRVT